MSSQNTSIGSCPSHWDVVKFSTVAELKHGYQFRTTDFTEQGIKVLKITQIKDNGSIDISSCSFIDAGRLKNFENNIVKKGDILMALSGATIGKIGRYKSDEIVLQNYRVGNFLPLDEQTLNKDYFYYFLTTENTYYQILANQNQSAQENVGKEDIHNMLVFLPPLPEQKSIASTLSSLDYKIDLLHRQNATLEEMAETLFRQWFVEEVKEDWKEETLADFISVKHGYAFKGEYISVEPTSLILVTPGNFKIGGGFKSDKFKYYTKDDFPSEYIFKADDLIVTMTDLSVDGDTLGYSALVPDNYKNEKYLHNQRVGKIEFKSSISKYFIYYLMKTEDYQWFILSGASGTSIRHTSPTSICSYKFKFPPKNKMYEFENVCSDMQKKIRNNHKQIRTLNVMRDSLLTKLMSGEVTVEI